MSTIVSQSKEIIAVFVSRGDWLMFEYADRSRSEPIVCSTGEVFVRLASEHNDNVWLTLKKALCCQAVWFPVEDVLQDI